MEKGGTPVDGKKGTILLAGAAVLLALTIWQGWTLREQGNRSRACGARCRIWAVRSRA